VFKENEGILVGKRFRKDKEKKREIRKKESLENIIIIIISKQN
jgi:hypothetical protein